MPANQNAPAAPGDADQDKRDRVNYGKTGAVEIVLINEAGPSLLHYQGSMTKADVRFDHICHKLKKALPDELTELTKQRNRMIEDGVPESLVTAETKKIDEIEAFIKNHLPSYTGRQLQLKLATLSKMVSTQFQQRQPACCCCCNSRHNR
jgi:hypothetical protein